MWKLLHSKRRKRHEFRQKQHRICFIRICINVLLILYQHSNIAMSTFFDVKDFKTKQDKRDFNDSSFKILFSMYFLLNHEHLIQSNLYYFSLSLLAHNNKVLKKSIFQSIKTKEKQRIPKTFMIYIYIIIKTCTVIC